MDSALLRIPVWSYTVVALAMVFNIAFAGDKVADLKSDINQLNSMFQAAPYDLVDVPHQLNVELSYKDDAPSGLYTPYSRLYRDGEIKIRYDRADDPLVITHEYIHALMERQQAKGSVARGPQRRTLEEGIAQYLACSIHEVSEYKFMNERVALDNSLSYPKDFSFSAYQDSRIVMGALWELRKTLGKDKTDYLLVKSLREPISSFSDLLVAMLAANDRYCGNWNQNQADDLNAEQIALVFNHHGIFENTTHTNYAALPDQTQYLLSAAKGGTVALNIQFQNQGPAAWLASGYDNQNNSAIPREIWLTSVDNGDMAYEQSRVDRKASPLNERSVAMGAQGSFSLTLQAPKAAGTYTYQYQPMAYLSQYVYDPGEEPVIKIGSPVTVVLKVL